MHRFALFALLLFVAALWAQDEDPEERPGREGMRERMRRGMGRQRERIEIQPYDKVITKKAKTDAGLFLVHRIEDKVFYEIPMSELGLPMLWVTQIEKTQSGAGYGGTPVRNRVVKWELKDENVLLRDVKFRIRADQGDESVKESVAGSSLQPIIMSFPVKAWGKDKAPVIEVTSLFMSDVPEFSAKRRLDAQGVDSKRTFFEGAKSFPDNIETKVLMTYRVRSGQDRFGRGGPTPTPSPRRRRGPRRDPSQSGVTVLLHHSMVRLPQNPMTPRRHDDRVGFFSVSFEDYADMEEHQVERVRFVTRWRLEKKDPRAEVSEPKKPIVFHVGRGVPAKWRKWVKIGIEMWQPAFEAAGFRNAILARDAPSKREDPDWDAEDARHSTIRWMPSTTENAMGPHVHDPRTGEILEADIIVYHNILKLVRDWYFVQASPSDPRAQKLPMPDDLIGELLAYVIAHEVGHSLGFPHNMKASSSFTVEQLRDAEFTKKWGTEASIMDYGRFNYVAQPGDGAALVPKIGPYDFFAVEWGYRQFKNPRQEKKGLGALVAKQKQDKMLRFGNADPREDPSRQTEDLGSDPIKATELGLKNIARVAGYLVSATCREGKNYDLLKNMYDRLVGQRNRELMHVASVVGGFVRSNLWYGDADRVYDPVARARQKEAILFLNRHAFQTPKELVQPAVLQRLEASGVSDRILRAQKSVLRSLISEARVKRMAEHTARDEQAAYRPIEMLQDVRAGIWSELDQSPVRVDLYRRNLQRAHVEILARFVKQEAAESDLPALSRGELTSILDAVESNEHKAKDRMTRLHLEDLKARIKKTLEPEQKPTETSALPANPGGG